MAADKPPRNHKQWRPDFNNIEISPEIQSVVVQDMQIMNTKQIDPQSQKLLCDILHLNAPLFINYDGGPFPMDIHTVGVGEAVQACHSFAAVVAVVHHRKNVVEAGRLGEVDMTWEGRHNEESHSVQESQVACHWLENGMGQQDTLKNSNKNIRND